VVASGGEMRVAAAGGGGGRGGARGVPGAPMTLSIDASTFTIGAGENNTVYRLDGTSTTTQTPRGDVVSKANWKGDKLVIETTAPGMNGPIVTTTTWYLDGQSLVRETSSPGPTGEAVVRKTIYKKSA
jgi:hypothetical protein